MNYEIEVASNAENRFLGYSIELRVFTAMKEADEANKENAKKMENGGKN